MNFNFNIQSHLIVGSSNKVVECVNNLLQSTFCQKNKCNNCIICKQIKNKEYDSFLWLKPERQYSLEQIDIVLKKTSLRLDTKSYYFIIFEQANLMTNACSNRLLKLIEEPPSGYYFLFLTNQPNLILATIYSRCVVTSLINDQTQNNKLIDDVMESEIGKYFIENNPDPVSFLKTIDKANINEYETFELISLLTSYWSDKYKNALISKDDIQIKKIMKILNTFHKSLEQLPMPGSSKIFLRNLFINFLN